MRILASVVLAALLAVPLHAESTLCSSSTGRSLTVHGVSVQRLRPDRVSFTVGVSVRNSSAAEAFKMNSTRINSVIAALKARGVTSEEIQTSNFTISTLDPTRTSPRRFEVANTVSVTRSDLTTVGDLLEAAIEAGANEAYNLTFQVSDIASVREQGLSQAFQDARARAEALAVLSRRALGDVICVTDDPDTGPGFEMEARLRSLGYAHAKPAPNFEAGLEERSFHVSVIFELK